MDDADRERAERNLERMVADEESDWPARLLASVWRARALTVELSPRELDVLRCASFGLTLSMTAETLGIALDTVLSHGKRARFKLGAKNTAHAACEAIRRGLIP